MKNIPIANKPIKSDLLSGKYSDRWEKMKQLMDSMPTKEYLPKCKLKEGEVNPAVKFNFQFSGHPYFNLAFDTHILDPDNIGAIQAEETFNMEYVCRKKIYISQKNIWQYEGYLDDGGQANEPYEYFIEMKKDFDKIIKPYYDTHFEGIQDKYEFWTSMMMVEYACPFANDDNAIEMRTFNTNVWGPEHCDETVAGLHVGENVREFQASYTGEDGEYLYVPELMDDHYFFFYGEESQQFGYTPIYHRMVPHDSEPSSTRYSIIIDLETREIED
jgi:hypothetical protein